MNHAPNLRDTEKICDKKLSVKHTPNCGIHHPALIGAINKRMKYCVS